MAEHEIKTIVAELQSMSPRTQLEIVRLCKKVAELTPDYIDALVAEAKAELEPLLMRMSDDIDNEITARRAIVENVNGENKLKTTGTSELAGVYVSDAHTDVANEHSVEIDGGTYMVELNETKAEMHSIFNDESVKISNHEITITNNSHVLKLDANGGLTLDGAAVGSGSELYEHNVILTYSSGGTVFNVTLNVINNSNIEYSSPTDLYYYLESKRLTDNNHVISVSGITRYLENELHFINALYVLNNRFYFGYYDTTDQNYAFHYMPNTSFTLKDRVVALS